MKINVEFIDQKEQRYGTVGDYWIDDNGDMQIRVSKMGNEIYESAVLIHELIEFFLIRKKGHPTEPEIMSFDIEFEEKRNKGEVDEYDEPGFAENSPYRQEHTIATACEMAFIAMSGESWNKYDNTVINCLDNNII